MDFVRKVSYSASNGKIICAVIYRKAERIAVIVRSVLTVSKDTTAPVYTPNI